MSFHNYSVSIVTIVGNNIKMETKKYGVRVSALNSLKEFQRSLLKKKKTFTMPFCGQCLISVNDKPPARVNITANPGMISSEAFGVIHLKNKVETITETDTEVLLKAKESTIFFTKILLKFDTNNQKQHFMTSIENILSSDSDSDESIASDSSTDSGL